MLSASSGDFETTARRGVADHLSRMRLTAALAALAAKAES